MGLVYNVPFSPDYNRTPRSLGYPARHLDVADFEEVAPHAAFFQVASEIFNFHASDYHCHLLSTATNNHGPLIIYFTHCPFSNASMYTIIDRAITKTKGRSVQEYVFRSMVFANIYVQGRGKGECACARR